VFSATRRLSWFWERGLGQQWPHILPCKSCPRTCRSCRCVRQEEAQDMLSKVLEQKSRAEQFTLTLKDRIVEGFVTGSPWAGS
jgi:hypothetical protein